nr:MAG TPA: hypothetical protein [Caudoviricetes sp.]
MELKLWKKLIKVKMVKSIKEMHGILDPIRMGSYVIYQL